MTVVENIGHEEELNEECSVYRRTTITLGFEDRQKVHGRRRSDDGLEFAISLDAGLTLTSGDCFILKPDRVVVVVKEALEAVFVLKPTSKQDWAYCAYQIGNRHQKLMVSDNELVCLQDPAVKSLFDQLDLSYEEDSRPFTAVTVTSGHHSH